MAPRSLKPAVVTLQLLACIASQVTVSGTEITETCIGHAPFAWVHASQVTVSGTEITEAKFEEIQSDLEDIVQERLDTLLSIDVECPVSVRGCGCKQRLG